MSAEHGPNPALVEALHRKVKHLEAKLDDVESENEHLQTRVEKLEAELETGGESWP